MSAMTSQITGVSIDFSSVGSGADQRKHQSSASLAFVRGIHRWPVNSPHKRPVTRKMFPFDDVIMSGDRFGSVNVSLGCIILINAVVFNRSSRSIAKHAQYQNDACKFKTFIIIVNFRIIVEFQLCNCTPIRKYTYLFVMKFEYQIKNSNEKLKSNDDSDEL